VSGTMSSISNMTIRDRLTKEDPCKLKKVIVDLSSVNRVINDGMIQVVEAMLMFRTLKSNVRWILKGSDEVVQHLYHLKIESYLQISENEFSAKRELSEAA
jgi:hypothetical protein